MSTMQGVNVVVQATPRAISMNLQGWNGVIVHAESVLDASNQLKTAFAVLLGGSGSRIIRTFWEDEIYVPPEPVPGPTPTPTPTPTPNPGPKT